MLLVRNIPEFMTITVNSGGPEHLLGLNYITRLRFGI